MTGGGGLIVNVCAFEAGPAEFLTVIDAVPAAATLAAGTIAVSCVEETNVVVRAEPFQLTFEVESKLVPFTVKVNWLLPAMVELGLIEVVVGFAASTVLAVTADSTRTSGKIRFMLWRRGWRGQNNHPVFVWLHRI
jgi:hypothetical protein